MKNGVANNVINGVDFILGMNKSNTITLTIDKYPSFVFKLGLDSFMLAHNNVATVYNVTIRAKEYRAFVEKEIKVHEAVC
jgi:hypothetical protein